MENGFTPSTAFEGYVKASLENIEKKFDDLPCKESSARIGAVEQKVADISSKRISAIEQKVANIEGKTTIFGAIAGFVAGIISKVLMGK